MKHSSQKIGWFKLDLLFVIYLVSLFVERRSSLSQGEHKLVLVVMTIGLFSLIGLWTWANQYVLEARDRQDHPVHSYRISVHSTPTVLNEADKEVETEPIHDIAA
jgi:hypothetical protein